jgi:hypothetical protein
MAQVVENLSSKCETQYQRAKEREREMERYGEMGSRM